MCIRPSKLKSGVLVACRKCWQCRANRINDWVGRCIAESETSVAWHSVTLTYGSGDHERAAVLTYSDVQKYLKLLRRHGYPVRYFAVGEFGSKKGRSHWHLMLFWQGDVPEHVLRENFMERHWPHGYSFWDESGPAAVRYVCKYLQKDIGAEERQGHLAMSKKPPLGAKYFTQLAGRYVDQGVAPLAPYYWFGHVRGQDDKPTKFYMQGVTLDNFCQSFLEQWRDRYGTHPPTSELLEEYEDRQAKLPVFFDLKPFVPRQSMPWIEPPQGVEIQWSEPLNSYYYDHDGTRLYWSFDKEGRRAWLDAINIDPDGPFGRVLQNRTRYRATGG